MYQLKESHPFIFRMLHERVVFLSAAGMFGSARLSEPEQLSIPSATFSSESL